MKTIRSAGLVLVATLAACGGSTGPEDEVDPYADAPYSVVACEGLQPAATSGVPLSTISLGSSPTTLTPPLAAFVETADPAENGWAIVRVEGGNATIVTPIHPSASVAGGSVTLWITDGIRSCAPIDFTVQALTPAPGELAAIADLIQAMVDAQATALETSRQALIDTPVADLPASVIPLAVVQSLLDHPDNDRSLAALVAGTSPDAADARLDLLEPLLATTGLKAALEGAMLPRASTLGIMGASGSAPARVSAATCTPGSIGNDAGLLDACMDAALEANIELAGASGEVLRGMATFFTAASVVPGLGTATAIAGFVSWMALNDKLRTAALLPSALTGMTVQVGPVEFMEDEAGPGEWYGAQLTATNLGFDLGREFLEGLLMAAGAAGAFGGEEIGEQINGVLLTIATGPAVAELIGEGTLEDFQIPPEVFGPVDVSAEMWSESRIATGSAVVRASHSQYEPRAVGSAVLSVRTKDGEFAGQQEAVSTEIVVSTLGISIAPEEVFVGASDPWAFTVSVQGSSFPQMVEIDPAVTLQGTATITYNDDGTHTVNYTAPGEPDVDVPDLLTVRHSAETGARGFSSTERNSIATIRFGGVRITTEPACLDTGANLQFEAIVPGAENPELVWSVSAGSITSDGYFTAPDQAQFVEVTVAYADNPDVRDAIQVQVGGCSCRVSVAYGGADAGSTEVARFFLNGDQSGVIQLDWASTGGISGGSANVFFYSPGAEKLDTIPVGTTGTFTALGQGRSAGVVYTNLGVEDPPTSPLLVTLTVNDGNVLEGSAIGSMIPTGDSIPVGFSMDFHIEADPAWSTATTRVCRIE